MNTTNQLTFDRSFQLWSYTVSHGQLLLRSTKTAQTKSRIDVLFKNVALINLVPNLDGLTIREVAPEDVKLSSTDARLKGRKVFHISSNGFSGHVIAGVVVSHEDDGEYDDRSALLPH